MTASSGTARNSVLFLRLQPSWTAIDEIRRFVEKFCAMACPREERKEQVALATHELVQNAIANAASPDIELRLVVDPGRARVRVSVTNDARPDQIEVLRSCLEKAQSPSDALDAYLQAMREDPHSRGGIGLARIRFEGALDLALEVDGGRVTIHADGPLVAPDLGQRARYRAPANPSLA